MFANPFDTQQGGPQQNSSPFYQAPVKARLTLDDIIDALQNAKISMNQARAAVPQQPQGPSIAIDLRQNPQAFIIAEKPFATGEVYKPVSNIYANLSDAKRELLTRRRQAKNTANIALEIVRVKLQGALSLNDDETSSEDDDEEENSVATRPVVHDNDREGPRRRLEEGLKRSLNSGRMPIGADVMDSRLPEEEQKKFKESFSHFDDDVVPETKSSATIDIDRWFDNPSTPLDMKEKLSDNQRKL